MVGIMMNLNRIIRTYDELIQLPTFEERFEYLKLAGEIGEDKFGFMRVFNQQFYRSTEWKRVRREVIIRDNGCDLAHPDHPIFGTTIVHHMVPIEMEDLEEASEFLLNPKYLITISDPTHRAITYGNVELRNNAYIERTPNDTCPWKIGGAAH
jgi:hypothetical protein